MSLRLVFGSVGRSAPEAEATPSSATQTNHPMKRIALEEHFVLNEPTHLERWLTLILMTPLNLSKITVGVIRLSKLAGLGVFAVAIVTMSPTATLAQSTPSAAAPDPAFAVPTTKLLAIGSFTAKATPNAWKALVPSEMRQTALLYLAGKIGSVVCQTRSERGRVHTQRHRSQRGQGAP